MFAIRDWDHGGSHEKTNISKSLMFAIGAALLVGTIGFFMVGGKQSSEARAEKTRTTETTAALRVRR
jgi:hypothetical protein